MASPTVARVVVKAEIDQPEVKRALDDLHAQFEQAHDFISRQYSGPTKAADQGTLLIETYSKSVERILLALRPASTDIQTGAHRG